jgi:hypothetical protein
MQKSEKGGAETKRIYMRRFKIKEIYLTALLVSIPSTAMANMVWPALYVADSHFRFWYVAAIGLFLEAGVLRFGLIPSIKKALLASFIVNAISGTVGIYFLAFSMVGWHFVVDNLAAGSFSFFNKVATITLMLIGSVSLETLAARVIWKYPISKTFPLLILGNILSYGIIVADLFAFGGWHRQL